jgi:hypothetical protein
MENIEQVLKGNFSGEIYSVSLIWEPAWSADFITPNGKKILGLD